MHRFRETLALLVMRRYLSAYELLCPQGITVHSTQRSLLVCLVSGILRERSGRNRLAVRQKEGLHLTPRRVSLHLESQWVVCEGRTAVVLPFELGAGGYASSDRIDWSVRVAPNVRNSSCDMSNLDRLMTQPNARCLLCSTSFPGTRLPCCRVLNHSDSLTR